MVVVATYNVHRAVGRDGVADIARLTRVIAELGADIVGLQEIDCSHVSDPLLNHLARLADRLSMHPAAAPLVDRTSVGVGIAVLSKHPISARRFIDLAVPGREPRAALDLDIATPHGPLRLVNTHLGLKNRERDQQMARLIAHVKPERPTVIVGDFNEWRWRCAALSQMAALFAASAPRRTFPASRPLAALDRIFVHPAAALTEVAVVSSAVAKVTSDHLPLRAVVELDAPPIRGLP